MTGSGTAQGPTAVGQATVELRSVNGRGLALKFRLPAEFSGAESTLEAALRARLRRGSVVCAVDLEPGLRPLGEVIDAEAFRAAAAQLRTLAQEASLPEPTVADVLSFPGVSLGGSSPRIRTSRAPDADFLALVDAAVEQLLASRSQEGAGTAAAMTEHLDHLERELTAIRARVPEFLAEHRERLLQRVGEFLSGRGLQIEADDVVKELALFAERSDISEELQRIDSHVGALRQLLAKGGEVGRRSEFLIQEMLREVNTLGSKSPDADIAHTVVGMKAAIDRLKEQAANLE